MGGLLPTVKQETYRDYSPRRVALAESALLSVWGALGSYHDRDSLVLVGGLVPKYLCRLPSSPLCVTTPSHVGCGRGDLPCRGDQAIRHH